MKRGRWRILLALAMLAMFAANHLEHHFRARRIQRQAQEQDVPVLQVVTSESGHDSLQIGEQARRSGYLYFNTLESWAYSRENPTPCPQSVMAANGSKVKLTGFMFPLQDADNLTIFALLRSTQTCCYGPRPQYNQYVFVEMAQPVKFERLAPVVVEGRFFVDPKPDQGYIYRMEGESVRHAFPDDQPANAADFARRNKLPVFDFDRLAAAKTAADREAEIARLTADFDGKQMVASGLRSRQDGRLADEDHGRRVCLGRQGQRHTAEHLQRRARQPPQRGRPAAPLVAGGRLQGYGSGHQRADREGQGRHRQPPGRGSRRSEFVPNGKVGRQRPRSAIYV